VSRHAPPGSGKIETETGKLNFEPEPEPGQPTGTGPGPTPKGKSFHGSMEVPAASAKSKLNTIADEIIAILVSDPNASLRVTVEIEAEFPNGASDTIKRGVSENATSMGVNTNVWE
jgi:uncharacterized protein